MIFPPYYLLAKCMERKFSNNLGFLGGLFCFCFSEMPMSASSQQRAFQAAPLVIESGVQQVVLHALEQSKCSRSC